MSKSALKVSAAPVEAFDEYVSGAPVFKTPVVAPAAPAGKENVYGIVPMRNPARKTPTGKPSFAINTSLNYAGLVITKIAPNPKRPGTAGYARFENYAVGETLSALVTSGKVWAADVRWDLARGFIEVAPR